MPNNQPQFDKQSPDDSQQVSMLKTLLSEARQARAAKDADLATLTRERDEARAFGVQASEQYNALLKASCDVTCAFCGATYPRGTPRHGDGALADHIKTCPQHPMRAVEREFAIEREVNQGLRADKANVVLAMDLERKALAEAERLTGELAATRAELRRLRELAAPVWPAQEQQP